MTLVGYTGAVSALPGDQMDLFLSTNGSPGQESLAVTRVAGAETATLTADVLPQAVPPVNAWEGFGWSSTTSFPVPGHWPSGYYEVRGPSDEVIGGFVVRSPIPGSGSSILVSIDLLTNQAYNGAGGKSLYDPGRASIVSFDRPGGLPDGRELPLLDWLAAEGVVVECCAAQDIGDALDLDSYDCLIVAGHSEYWTGQMRDAVERFVAGGGNLVCLSGNTAYRQVRLEDGGRTLVFHKYAGADPVGGWDATVAFAEPPVNRPQNALLGVGFTHGSWGAGQPAGYRLHFPGHWAMANVAGSSTSPFMSYETDAAAVVEEPEGYPRATGEEGTPVTFVPLGTADLRDAGWAKPGFATMGVYRRNATVFAAGTTDWVLALTGQPGFTAGPAVQTITRNVLGRLSARLPLDWELVGHADNGSAMTSVGNSLYLATTHDRLWRRHPVAADISWSELGHADNVVAMASDGAVLYAVKSNDTLWWRSPIESDVNWTPIGNGPGGTRALACAGGSLYAIDGQGTLMRRPATRAAAVWSTGPTLGQHPEISAMASANDILFAATQTDRLLRTDKDFISESSAWADILHCNFGVGLATVDGGLFVATTENLLWLLDLHGLRQP
jgi:hypothetical protein